MHADTDTGGYPRDEFPCAGVLLGVVELMRARGLLGDWLAAPRDLDSPGHSTDRAIEPGYPVGAASGGGPRPGTTPP